MKTISKQSLTKQIKKAQKEAADWKKYDFSRRAVIMIDTQDVEIWTDVFLSENSWKEYHSETVHQLNAGIGYQLSPWSSKAEILSFYLEVAISLLDESGWVITEKDAAALLEQDNGEKSPQA